jgi:nitrous oxidase accessory protein NosD
MTTRTILGTLILLGAFAGSALAATEVFPGPGTPLQDAIDAADPGDALLVHAGTYNESITIPKPLRLDQAHDGAVYIDAGCLAPTALTVASDDVKIRGYLPHGAGGFRITGGTVSDVVIQNQAGVSLSDSNVEPSCAGVQQGISVSASRRVRVTRTRVGGFRFQPEYTDAGVSLDGIPVGGSISLKGVVIDRPARGIRVENSPRGSRIALRASSIAAALDGVVLIDADGVLITGNTIYVIDGMDGIGVRLDSSSDDNRIGRNEIIASPPAASALDEGASNCWFSNKCSDVACPSAIGCP